MKTNKLFALLLGMMLCALLLVACGNPEVPAETQTTTEATQPQGAVKTDPFETEPHPEVDADPTLPPDLEENRPSSDLDDPRLDEIVPTEPDQNRQPESSNQPTETLPTEPEDIVPPTTQPTEPGEEPVLEDDELPLVPAF